MKTIYLAGGLFNAGERLHNLYLESHLRALGYKTILPQRQALLFFRDGLFDVNGIVSDCQKYAVSRECMYVGNSDGADADSGTAIEYGMAIIATKTAVVYRTDFRTAPEKGLGVNAMFRAQGTQFIYEPCFFTELHEVDDYYRKLAGKIHEAVESLQ